MTFVISFLSIFIYVSYVIYEKERDNIIINKTKSNIDASESLYKKWINTISDYNEENIIKLKILDFNSTDYIYNSVYPIVKTFEHFDMDFNNGREFKLYMVNNHNLMIERILMAMNGKLLKNDAMFGIKSPMVYNSCEKRKWMINNDMMLWINNTFRSKGIINDTYFIKNSECIDIIVGDKKSVSLSNVINPVAGIYYWYPIKNKIYNYA